MNDTIKFKPTAALREFIKKLFNIFNELDFDIRRPLSYILWALQDRKNDPDVFDRFSAKKIYFKNVEDELIKILGIHDFLRKCCGNEYIHLAHMIDIIYFRDESPLKIAKADYQARLEDFERTIYQSGDYKKKVFFHIFNMGSIESPVEPILGDFDLETLNPYQLPLLIGESSFFSSLHPFEATSFFLTKEDNLPCSTEEVNLHIATSWQKAIFLIQPFKYLKDSPIGIDYGTLLFSPHWLNSIRREGIFLYGRPLIPISHNLYHLTTQDMNLIGKWQNLFGIPEINAKMNIEYMRSNNITIPDMRKTIYIAVNYYDNYVLKYDLADQFAFLIFALEALFSTGTESTYRICMHASTLLSDYGPKRNEIYNFIKDVLGKRNAFVHGRKLFYELDIDDSKIAKLASYVRLSIRNFISLYLTGKEKRKDLLDKLEILALGKEPYELFEKQKDLELFVNMFLEEHSNIPI